MDSSKKRITSITQFNLLLWEMANNPEFARGVPVFGSNQRSMDNEWERVKGILNANGPPVRSTAEWKKVWTDLKNRSKRKLSQNAAELRRTGGGPYCAAHLNPQEEETVRIMNMQNSVLPIGAYFGVEYDNSDSPVLAGAVVSHRASGAASTDVSTNASAGVTINASPGVTTNASAGVTINASPGVTTATASPRVGNLPTMSRKRKAADDLSALLQQQLSNKKKQLEAMDVQNGHLERIAIALEQLVKQKAAADSSPSL